MVRTNIEIDEELVERAMRRYRLPSRRAAVDLALRRLVGDAMTREEALAMEGTGWDGDLDAISRRIVVCTWLPVAWRYSTQATGSQVHTTMRRLIAEERDLVITDVVVMEVLAGARTEERLARLRRLLNRFELVPIIGLADFEAAADIYRRCRRGGETVRKLSDCLIAAVALRANADLLHSDRDFEVIARHLPLRVAR